jgi:hypothetical protein
MIVLLIPIAKKKGMIVLACAWKRGPATRRADFNPRNPGEGQGGASAEIADRHC